MAVTDTASTGFFWKLNVLYWEGVDTKNCIDSKSSSIIVFLHGLGDGAVAWKKVIESWPVYHSRPAAIAIDLPGHGGSDWWPVENYNVIDVSEHIARFLIASGIRDPIFVGHSLGADIAVELATFAEFRNSVFILVELALETSSFVREAIKSYIEILINGDADLDSLIHRAANSYPLVDYQILQEFLSQLVTSADGRSWVPHDPRIECFLSAASSDSFSKRVVQMSQSVVLIKGVFSSVLSHRAVAQIAQERTGRTLVKVIPSAGHAILLEQPHKLAETLADLVAGLNNG